MTTFALLVAVFTGCGRHAVPDPKDAASEYEAAVSKGDADAIYAMMSASARKSLSANDVRKLLSGQQAELVEKGKLIAAPNARASATARLRYEDGEEAHLELREGRFWVTAAGALPGGSRTPEQALDQLRRVLARRSYAGLMRVLSPSTRAAIEKDLRSLVTGLERADTLHIQISGETGTVAVPGGHSVKLKREGGIWRIDDFD